MYICVHAYILFYVDMVGAKMQESHFKKKKKHIDIGHHFFSWVLPLNSQGYYVPAMSSIQGQILVYTGVSRTLFFDILTQQACR